MHVHIIINMSISLSGKSFGHRSGTDQVGAGVEAAHVPQHQHVPGGVQTSAHLLFSTGPERRRRRRDEGHGVLLKQHSQGKRLKTSAMSIYISRKEVLVLLQSSEKKEEEGNARSSDWTVYQWVSFHQCLSRLGSD